jgi:hypothetical protein
MKNQNAENPVLNGPRLAQPQRVSGSMRRENFTRPG